MVSPVPLDPKNHARKKIVAGNNLAPALGQQLLPLSVYEFGIMGSECPVVFVKNSENGQFQPVALLGFEQGENLMYAGGEWQGEYIPAALRNDPFKLFIAAPGADTVSVAIDEESPLLSEDEGESLFDAEGNATPYLLQRTEELQRAFQQGQMTQTFVSHLAELDLLHMQELNGEIDGKKFSLKGIYLVNEARLRELDDKAVLDLYRRGMMQSIYAHLMSQGQLRQLVSRKRARDAGGGSKPT